MAEFRHPALPETEQGDTTIGAIPLGVKATFQVFPWKTKLYDMADVSAIKAVAAGTANAEQQIRAMQYIRHVLCAENDMTYRTGDNGRRDSDFAEGARFVAIQLARIINSSSADLLEWLRKKVK